MLVGAASGDRPSQAVGPQLKHRGVNGSLVEVHHGVAIARLVACVDQCIRRQRVVVRSRRSFLDQRSKDATLDGIQFHSTIIADDRRCLRPHRQMPAGTAHRGAKTTERVIPRGGTTRWVRTGSRLTGKRNGLVGLRQVLGEQLRASGQFCIGVTDVSHHDAELAADFVVERLHLIPQRGRE
jgi:hypothetical protein